MKFKDVGGYVIGTGSGADCAVLEEVLTMREYPMTCIRQVDRRA